ncbi:MAG: alpha/beta hydrolase [Pseudoxanthomonas sp.]
MNKRLRVVLIIAIALPIVWVSVGALLISTPAPTFAHEPYPLRPSPSSRHTCRLDAATRCFSMRDGAVLHAHWFEAGSDTTVVLVHGVMSNADEMAPTAEGIRGAASVNVATLDLRGHGGSQGTFGDIDYIGQYDDDLADVVQAIRKQNPKSRVILAGHSMGGGIVMRYAAKPAMPLVDGYLLFAPLLGEQSPTTRTPTATPTGQEASFETPLKVHLRRTIGLIMLNSLGISAFNHLGTLYFNVSADRGRLFYSFAAMADMAPDDYRVALRADDKPLLLIAGTNDEAFDAKQYPSVVLLHPNGRAVLVPGATHDGIMRNPAAFSAVATWLQGR